ncbi:hypothetical protein [Desulforhopalus singaporensis]|uniref:Uncharacterized protein n=1 Tax=Desulforhopalus singaporensis TaxID=91360 RepID=A0A1H0QMN2_9BACT|nr:hypothetical protein [Desulforhopalus singaporensis]SDP18584.1 hypothetical protein SAMN05660330_02038 [Desulforhopalus singaporensis]
MSEEKIEFISYEDAIALVGAIQEEEDIDRPNKRIFTVYSIEDKELCWFDYEEVIKDVGEVEAGERKEAVQNYILNRIPTWVREL